MLSPTHIKLADRSRLVLLFVSCAPEPSASHLCHPLRSRGPRRFVPSLKHAVAPAGRGPPAAPLPGDGRGDIGLQRLRAVLLLLPHRPRHHRHHRLPGHQGQRRGRSQPNPALVSQLQGRGGTVGFSFPPRPPRPPRRCRCRSSLPSVSASPPEKSRCARPQRWETFAVKDPDEIVQSPVRMMPDRSVMYKYLNPNLLLVATSSQPGVGVSICAHRLSLCSLPFMHTGFLSVSAFRLDSTA